MTSSPGGHLRVVTGLAGPWVEESDGQDRAGAFRGTGSVPLEEVGHLPAPSPASQADAGWSCHSRGWRPQNPKLPSGPLQKNLLAPGPGSAGGAKASLAHTSMDVYRCDGQNFICRNRWQLDVACGLWFADPGLEHKLQCTEVHGDFQLSTANCRGSPVWSRSHGQGSRNAWQTGTGWLSGVSSFQVGPTTTFQSERQEPWSR